MKMVIFRIVEFVVCLVINIVAALVVTALSGLILAGWLKGLVFFAAFIVLMVDDYKWKQKRALLQKIFV